MDNVTIWELIGYLGSFLVVVSLLMSSVIKLRIINTVGSLIFTVYAIVIKSYPTAVMNAALIIINIYYLVKLLKARNHFAIAEAKTDDSAVQRIISLHREDIRNYFPDWNEKEAVNRVFIQFLNEEVAGITLGQEHENGILVLKVDYSTPHFRDCKLGSFVYDELFKLGFSRLVYSGNGESHRKYLLQMGFEQEGHELVKINDR
ncbi:MAG: YgjV family protein [Lachnospiraceae bacterium]|nr:YgjV family protein [Lachnospiraceae bacterium]